MLVDVESPLNERKLIDYEPDFGTEVNKRKGSRCHGVPTDIDGKKRMTLLVRA